MVILSLLSIVVLSDFVGPTYPAPKDLTGENSHVAIAWKNVTSTMETSSNEEGTKSTSAPGLKDITFSMGMFSIHDATAAGSLQYHHVSAEVASSTLGLTNVDGDSIYRVASLTKLITAFAGMIELDDRDWDRPITDFVPSLSEFARTNPGEDDPVTTIQWDQVTLVALASHLAGTPRDVAPYDGSDVLYQPSDPITTYGLPVLNLTDPIAFPPCVNSPDLTSGTCSMEDYVKGAQARPPVFLPWTSPQYTDFGFMMLGHAIASITNKSIHEIYRESIFGPLGMESSLSLPPQDNASWENVVLPRDILNSPLSPALAPEVTLPSGGIFSTINDLAKLGTAILNSTLLSPEQTRKWMKPISHTDQLQYAVGRPWEIYRHVHRKSGIVTDIYTKSGDSGAYGGYIVLIPNFDAGFSIIGTSTLPARGLITAEIADIVTNSMLPALQAQAEAEAEHNFAGTYISTDKNLDTRLVISLNHTEHSRPGLVLSSFVSNGTDLLDTLIFGGTKPIRLLPSVFDAQGRKAAFRTSPFHKPKEGLFLGSFNVAADWITGDSGTYGGLAVGLFVFDLNASGSPVAVEPAAWRVKLSKELPEEV
ncbi:MAG: hypothetical protein Q9219_002638 [cf. Caloplaca sp. 3 TL-2023]